LPRFPPHPSFGLMRIARFALALLLAAASASGQQVSAKNDASLQRMWRLGMDSSHLESLAYSLIDSIGPRLTGSPALLRASDWILKTYSSWGIDSRREQFGTWRGWRRGWSHVDLVAPRVRSLEATMLAGSPGTRGQTLSAEAIVLPKFRDSLEFLRWLPLARGKIVLLSPSWPACRPSEDWMRWATPPSLARIDSAMATTRREWSAEVDAQGRVDSARLYRGTGYNLSPRGTGMLGLRLEKAGVAAMALSQPKLTAFPDPGAASTGRGTGGWGTMEVYETYNRTAPAVAISCEDYDLVFALAEHGAKPIVRLDLDASALGEQPAFNTLAEIKGHDRPNEYIVLSGHLDSWDGASGATDNGTATVMVMEAMRILSLAYPHPKRTIIAAHWAGEEQHLVGSLAFSEDHPEIMSGIQAVFNQDNGTGRVQEIYAAALPDIARHLRSWYERLPAFYTDSVSPNVVKWTFKDEGPRTGGTDGAVFSCKGAPAFFLYSLDWNYFAYTWHSNRDTYDKIVFDDLRHNATLLAMLVYAASEDPEFISRRRSAVTWPATCGTAPRRTRPLW